MARKDVVGAVPMLRTLAKQSKPKTDCCGRSSSRRQGLRQARTRLVGLPQNQKDYLKNPYLVRGPAYVQSPVPVTEE
jgi:hypothetical protein